MDKNKQKRTFRQKLHDKYRIVVYSHDTYEERFHIRLSRLNVLALIVILSILLIFITTYIIAFTSLREYIPGYTDVNLNRRVYEMERRADSLERVFYQKDLYINNLKNIINGYDNTTDSINSLLISDQNSDFANITISKSEQDSLFRVQFEQETQYNLFGNNTITSIQCNSAMPTLFVPLVGIVTNHFNSHDHHYGTDLVSTNNAVIKATADGTVIYSDWSIEKGYIIGIQHSGNLFSVYKHNAALLKREGDVVKAGDAIAIVGESGNLSTGPHLHFELWFNGIPLNPEEYVSFEVN